MVSGAHFLYATLAYASNQRTYVWFVNSFKTLAQKLYIYRTIKMNVPTLKVDWCYHKNSPTETQRN